MSPLEVSGFGIRMAKSRDMPLIFQFVRELADYENLLSEVTATEESIKNAMFERKIAEAIIAEIDGEPIGFALYYYNLSTFIGRSAIYIEDLFVKPDFRGNGFGKAMLVHLANLAKERDCWGLEWACLGWNTPSIKFYQSLGAVSREEWITFRLRGEALDKLALEK